MVHRLRKRFGAAVTDRIKAFLRFCFVLGGLALVVMLASVLVSSRPRFCTTCHYMQPYYDSWAASSHKDVPCIDCHYPPGLKSELRRKFEASVQVAKYVTRQYGTRPWTEIDDASCLRSGCHDRRLLSGTVEFKGVRFDHVPHMTSFRKVTRLRCTSCHSQIVQGTHMAATPTTCYLCHFKNVPENEKLAECTLCHELADMNGQDSSEGEGMDHSLVVERGVSCAECHEDVVRGDGYVAREVCLTCHAEPERLLAYDLKRVGALHAHHVTEHKIDCTVCHQAITHGKPEEKKSADLDCSLCHPNQHRSTMALYEGHAVGDLKGEPDPMSAVGVRCISCHRTHREVPGGGTVMAGGSAGCMNCHGEGYGKRLAEWRIEIPALLSKVEAGVNEGRRRAERATSNRVEAIALCKKAYHNARLVKQGNGVHNVPYARELLKDAAQKVNTAMDLIGDSFRVSGEVAPTKLAESKCLSCHDAPPTGSVPIYGVSFSHERHVGKAQIACERCHGQASLGEAGHGTLKLSRDGCRTCHTTQLRSYHAGGWLSRHGRAGRTSCRVCHSESYCNDCHAIPMPHPKKWTTTHGGVAADKAQVCRKCHKDQAFCVRCHGTQMPHADDWVLEKHGKSFRQNEKVCAKCHASDDCAECHGTPMPHARDWLRTHGRHAEKDADSCSSCHQPAECLLCHKASPLPSHAGKWRKQHDESGQKNKALCSLCHGPRGGCTECHGVDMPHPDDWVLEGHKPVASFSADSVCSKCHDRASCEPCHSDVDGSQ